MAKGQKTGGRQKGTPNKASATRTKAIAESGLTPLDYMLQVLRAKGSSKDDKKWAATAAAPYCHPKLSSVIMGGDPKNPMKMEHSLTPAVQALLDRALGRDVQRG